MLSVKNSKFLAKIKQIAIYNQDKKMINKIEKIKNDYEIDFEIRNYKLLNNLRENKF